jgi:alkylation response protein AidB-like acyl-CoA dehydrogenase
MQYVAPVDHMRFVLERTAGLDRLRAFPAFAEVSPDLVEAVLQGAATFAGDVLAPLNETGDREGAKLTPDGVRTPKGFRDAYRRFVDDGWAALAGNPEHGGQGMPFLLSAAVGEMWAASNMAFALCPELGLGAVDALERHATPELRDRYIAKLISGEWSGTMCLTEPQAGSDLSVLQTRAVPDGEAYRLFGRKIYITWGEHDMAANVVHLVLARLPDAPPGVRGISLFLVPRRLVNDDGSLGAVNDIRAVSLEHKMGIHASPTCVMAIGDAGGAKGWLVGKPNEGLAAMFTMMNNMRVGVGIQGVGLADQAWQIASRYARERVQGRGADGRPTTIVHHADVRRMLLTMKSLTMAARGVAYAVAGAIDVANHAPSDAERAAGLARAELLTPVVKAWCTEVGMEVASLGVQVLGGAGYTEDAGAAQVYRDARITAIYEGTNSIQAQDLLGRKVLRDGGRALEALLGEMSAAADALPGDDERLGVLARGLRESVDGIRRATAFVLANVRDDAEIVGSVAVNYLMLVGYACGAWQWALSSAAAREDAANGGPGASLAAGLLDAAGFYAAAVLPRAKLHAELVTAGSAPIVNAEIDAL